MNEDENKAIEILTSYKNQLKDRKPFNCSFVDMQWAIGVILDLYNKEKAKNIELKVLIENNLKYSHKLEKDLFENASNYVISKDKIRAKITEMENIQNETYMGIYMYANEIKILNELLEDKTNE